jgi:hypothetical protein
VKIGRWIIYPLLLAAANGVGFLIAFALLAVSLGMPFFRLLRFARRGKPGERLTPRELLSYPLDGLRFLLLTIKLAWLAHRVYVGDV